MQELGGPLFIFNFKQLSYNCTHHRKHKWCGWVCFQKRGKSRELTISYSRHGCKAWKQETESNMTNCWQWFQELSKWIHSLIGMIKTRQSNVACFTQDFKRENRTFVLLVRRSFYTVRSKQSILQFNFGPACLMVPSVSCLLAGTICISHHTDITATVKYPKLARILNNSYIRI